MYLKRHLSRICAASLAILLPSLAAKAQCQATGNLEQYTALPSNGGIKTMAEWDPDGSGGNYSNLMVMGGSFTTMGNLTGLPGLVGWDGSHYVPVPVGPTPWAPTTALLYNWQTGNGPWLVQVSDGPDPTLAINTGSNWSNITQFIGGTVTAVTSWAPLGPSGTNWLIVAGSNLRVGVNVGPANVLRFDGSSWQTVTNVSGFSNLVNTVGSWTVGGNSTGLMVGGSFDHLSLTPAAGGASVAVHNVGYVTYSSAGGAPTPCTTWAARSSTPTPASTLCNPGRAAWPSAPAPRARTSTPIPPTAPAPSPPSTAPRS